MDFAIKFEVAASDVERARAWYSSILGLEPVNPDEDEELLYRAGGTQFGIYRIRERRNQQGHRHAGSSSLTSTQSGPTCSARVSCSRTTTSATTSGLSTGC